MPINCWGKLQVASVYCSTLAGIWANASRGSQHHTCFSSRQGTLEVEEVGKCVPSQRTQCLLFSRLARPVPTCRHDKVVSVPCSSFLVSQSVIFKDASL